MCEPFLFLFTDWPSDQIGHQMRLIGLRLRVGKRLELESFLFWSRETFLIQVRNVFLVRRARRAARFFEAPFLTKTIWTLWFPAKSACLGILWNQILCEIPYKHWRFCQIGAPGAFWDHPILVQTLINSVLSHNLCMRSAVGRWFGNQLLVTENEK